MVPKGTKMSLRAKEKMSLSRMGKEPWNKGLSKEVDKRVAKLSEKISKALVGFKRPPRTKEHSIKIVETRKNNGSYIMSEEQKLKISLAHSGAKHYNWQGGKSFEEYSSKWVESFKELIRKRDNYCCQLCNKKQRDFKFDCHHIDYNKRNCNLDNLITLCRNCHSKTNFNRTKWTSYFTSKMQS